MENNVEVLALIPARGGSRSIPRKNLLSIAGHPLISYSIRHAIDSLRITRIIVSTDDSEISSVAQRYGAEVPFLRPKEYALDSSPDIDVFVHTLHWLKREEGYVPDAVVHLRPTGPVREPELIDNAIDSLLALSEADSLRSVEPAAQNPFKMWFLESGFMVPVISSVENPDTHSQPRQMLPVAYRQNGYVDVIRPDTILKLHSMAGSRVLPFVIDSSPNDIDYVDDIPLVEEAILRQRQGHKTGALRCGKDIRFPV